MPRSQTTPVCVEAAAKRAFASALDWPGWCRAGKDEAAALATLSAYAPRYEVVCAAAGIPFPGGVGLTVIERVPGTMTTQFGVPDVTAAAERKPMTASQARTISALMAAAWTVFDGVVATAPGSLRKGPRGGGRDRDKIVDHVLAAENAYSRKIGVRLRQPQARDRAGVAEARRSILDVIEAARKGTPPAERGWAPRYAARRIAWHVLDHAWEIEDRSPG